MSIKWIKIPSTNYLISNMGTIKTSNGRVKKTRAHNGYIVVDLNFGKIKKTLSVHRLVATAFIENPLGKKTVNHKDGNKANNNINNLERSTYRENIKHAFIRGLLSRKGIKNSKHKLNNKQVLRIRKLKGSFSTRVIGKRYGVSGETIRQIWVGKSWSHI